jgi:hypothetical protein
MLNNFLDRLLINVSDCCDLGQDFISTRLKVYFATYGSLLPWVDRTNSGDVLARLSILLLQKEMECKLILSFEALVITIIQLSQVSSRAIFKAMK